MSGLFDDAMTDDAKLMSALMRSGLAHHAHDIADLAEVDREYAVQALHWMASGLADDDYPVLARSDLGPNIYEAIEADAFGGSDEDDEDD
jgi:hypothetical protein